MLTEEHAHWIASFEPRYPALFARLRVGGWKPGETLRFGTTWASRAIHFAYNPLALQMELELGGLSLGTGAPGGGHHRFEFGPGQSFDNLCSSANDYDQDVFDILGATDSFPVGEGHGWVLFVTGTGRSALIEESLAAYIRADEPFVLLDLLLTGTRHDDRIEHAAVAPGTRVTGRHNT